MGGAKNTGKRIMSFLAGVFLIIFVALGWESKQLNLIGAIFYGIIWGVYSLVGFFRNDYVQIPFTQHGITTFFMDMALLFGGALIVLSLIGGGKRSSPN